jgi:hypothetical protein
MAPKCYRTPLECVEPLRPKGRRFSGYAQDYKPLRWRLKGRTDPTCDLATFGLVFRRRSAPSQQTVRSSDPAKVRDFAIASTKKQALHPLPERSGFTAQEDKTVENQAGSGRRHFTVCLLEHSLPAWQRILTVCPGGRGIRTGSDRRCRGIGVHDLLHRA